MSQIRWLSDLTLFDFDIKYRVGKTNQAADTSVSTCESWFFFRVIRWWGGVGNISYEVVCQILDYHLDSSKLSCNLKHEVQVNITDVSEANSSIGIKSNQHCRHSAQWGQTLLLNNSITDGRVSKECTQLSVIYEHVSNNLKPKLLEIHHIRSKPIRQYFYSLTIYHWYGVSASSYVYRQWWNSTVSLPHCLWQSVLQSLHDDNDHQGLQRIIELLHPKYIGLPCSQTLIAGFRNAKGVHIAKGDYTEPKTHQGNLTANQPLELLCIDFTKADAAKGGKENFLFLLMPFPNSANLLLHQVRNH